MKRPQYYVARAKIELRKGKEALQKYLELTGGDIDAIDGNATLLHSFALFSDPKPVQILIELGASILLPSKFDDKNALHIATSKAELQHLNIMLPALEEQDKLKEGLNSHDAKGDTALHHAARAGHKDCVDILLKYGADPSLINKSGSTPSDVALDAEFYAFADLLKAHNGQHKKKTATFNQPQGKTLLTNRQDKALLISLENKDVEGVHKALSNGANPNVLNKHGLTPLLALLSDKPSKINQRLCSQLLAKRADPNIPGPYGVTPLHIVAKRGDKGITTLLIASKADVNALRTDTNETPIIIAVDNGHIGIAEKMMKHSRSQPNQHANQHIRKLAQMRRTSEDKRSSFQVLAPQKKAEWLAPFSKALIEELETVKICDQTSAPLALLVKAKQENIQEQKQLGQERSSLVKISRSSRNSERSGEKGELVLLKDDLEQNKREQKALQAKLDEYIESSTLDAKALKGAIADIKIQLTDLQNNQNYLMAVQSVKAQRNKMRKLFRQEPNLWEFYRTLNIKLEELFIGCKAVASGIVDHNLSEVVGKIGMGVKLLGKAANIIPGVGNTLESLAKGVGGALEKIDHKRLENMLDVMSLLGTLGDIKKTCERVARHLTKRYENQLIRMRTLDEEVDALMEKRATGNIKEKLISNLKLLIQKGNKAVLKGKMKSPIEELVEFTVMELFKAIKNDIFEDADDLDEQFVKAICYPPEDRSKSKKTVRKLTKKFGVYTVVTKKEETWYLGDIFQRTGVQTAKGKFVGGKINPVLYGYCISEIDGEVEERGLDTKRLFRDTVVLNKSPNLLPSSPSNGKFIKDTATDLEEQKSRTELNTRQLANGVARRQSIQKHVGKVEGKVESLKIGLEIERKRNEKNEARLAKLERLLSDQESQRDESQEGKESTSVQLL